MNLLRHIRLFSLLLGLFIINNSAMAFSVLDKSGNNDNFAELSATGDWLLVMVWSHDCIPCERQKPMISKFASINKGKGIRVLGLSSDERKYMDKAKEIMHRSKTNFDNYLYNGDGFSNDYQNITGKRFLATPTYLVYSPDGTLDVIHVGTILNRSLKEYFADKKSDTSVTHSADLY